MQRRLTDDEKQKINDASGLLVNIPNASRELRSIREILADMLDHNTTDGRPYVEPSLTDEDARQRPWVMVRDCVAVQWYGPVVFVDKLPNGGHACRTRFQDGINVWLECRRATAAEIAAAGLEVTE